MSLDDDIRALCAKAAACSDEQEVSKILEQLRALLKMHGRSVKDMAAAHFRLWEEFDRD